MTPRSERCRPERILCLFVALFVLFGTQAVDVWHMRATYRSRVAERAAGKGPGAAPSASASAATPSPLRSFFSPPDAEEHRDATPAPHGPAASTTPPAPTTTTAAPAAPHTAPGAAPQAPRPGCEHPVAPLDQVTRWHNTSTVRFPSAHPEALCGRAAPTLLSGGALCTQEDICGYLKDVLVVLHINPQRFEWLEPLLEMAQAFAPHIMLVSIPALRDPDNDVTANMTSDDLRAHLSHMYLGPKRRYVHLVDTGVLAGMGDHNDIVMAMRLYPNFRGYLYWAQEDVLPGFWNFPRLDKEKPWYQEAGSYFSPSSLPRCPRKLYNKRKGGGRQSYKGRSCSIMRAKDMRDWKKLAPALDRIEREAPEDRAKVHPTYVPGINIYYVPRNMFVKFERYSAYFFHAEGYVEAVVVPLLQSAAAEGQGRETLRGLNVWPDKPGGRYHTVMEFQWANDFTHPVRATNDIMPRLRDVARRVQITAHLNSTTSEVLWDACYSCEQYPADGEYTQGRKGRYHSCSQGCSQPELSEPVSSRGGRVQITRNETHPEDEYPYEGFWNIESGRRLYQRIRNANRTDL